MRMMILEQMHGVCWRCSVGKNQSKPSPLDLVGINPLTSVLPIVIWIQTHASLINLAMKLVNIAWFIGRNEPRESEEPFSEQVGPFLDLTRTMHIRTHLSTSRMFGWTETIFLGISPLSPDTWKTFFLLRELWTSLQIGDKSHCPVGT